MLTGKNIQGKNALGLPVEEQVIHFLTGKPDTASTNIEKDVAWRTGMGMSGKSENCLVRGVKHFFPQNVTCV